MQKSKIFDNINKRLISMTLSILVILPFFGCKKSDSVQANEYPVLISDITIQKSPEKVVVLSDSLADIILALGLETKLVARTDECTQEELASLPSIGNKENINADKIFPYFPDLILTDKVMPSDFLTTFQSLSIPVIYLNPAVNRDSFISLYKDLGSVLAGGQTGKKLGEDTANNILMTLDDINRIIPKNGTVKTACYFYDSNKSVATGDTFASLLIELSGAVNVAKSSTELTIDNNTLKVSNPNYIFCAENTKNDLLKDSTVSSLSASQNGNIYEMNKFLMTRQGHTVIDAAAFMASKMYPEIAASNSSKSSNDESPSSYENDTTEEETSIESVLEETISNDQQEPETTDTDEPIQSSNDEPSDDILKMETRLDELDFMPSRPNGVFDEYTVRAITDFQYINGLSATGEANEQTSELLFSDDAIPRDEPSRDK